MKNACKTEEAVSITITDVPEDDWMNKVYAKEIKPIMENIYNKLIF